MDPLLVISFPDTSRDYSGVTLAVHVSKLAASNTSACHDTCVHIPAPAEQAGLLEATSALAASSGIGVDLGSQGADVSLPVSVVYFPQAQVVSGIVGAKPPLVDAPLAGLPLLPVPALFDTPSFPSGPNNVNHGYGWRISLGAGDYERDVVPTDDRFPPVISQTSITSVSAARPTYNQVDDAGVPGSTELTITWPEQDLSGFQVFLRNSVTQRRVSSRVTITEPAPGPLTLNTVGIPSLAGGPYEKVLAPPPGVPIPMFADPLPPTSSPMTAVIPVLPTPIDVSGLVETPDGIPIEADLLFDSTPANPLNDQGGIAINQLASSNENRNSSRRALSYSATAHSSRSGHYAVTLPPGEYDVFVSPTDPSVAASASNTMTIAVLTDKPFTAAGQTRVAGRFATLRGTVRAADGRPLSGARVEVHPTAIDVATIDPRRWRRLRTATTAADGTYSLDVEPGTGTLDMVVLPVDGTGFPVTTRSGVPVAAGVATSQDLVVPAPIAVDLVLHDPADNPVANALVRAFAVSATPLPSTVPPTVPHAALEIGSWRTDATGHFQMLLAPPP
jgi:hypothetical protein